MIYQLGETDTDVEVNTLDDNRAFALSLAEQARHSIDIFTQDLDTEIYDNEAFEQALFRLAKIHPSTHIRILVQDSIRSVKNGHRLIRLAQSLTSSITIHNPSREYENEKSAFLIVDRIGLLYRTNATDRNHKATVNFKAPLYAMKLTDLFDEIWQHSSPDIQTRRIYV